MQDPLRPEIRYGNGGKARAARASAATEPNWRLSAVLISSERRVAVLNGRRLQVGERIGGYRVAAIETDRVVLEKSGRHKIVRRSATGLKKEGSESMEGKKGNQG